MQEHKKHDTPYSGRGDTIILDRVDTLQKVLTETKSTERWRKLSRLTVGHNQNHGLKLEQIHWAKG